jgi:hypothetical protein
VNSKKKTTIFDQKILEKDVLTADELDDYEPLVNEERMLEKPIFEILEKIQTQLKTLKDVVVCS